MRDSRLGSKGRLSRTKQERLEVGHGLPEPAVAFGQTLGPLASPADVSHPLGGAVESTRSGFCRWRFDDAAASLPYGRWVVVEADDCPIIVGVLRQAQSAARGKLVTQDGRVVFFRRANAHLTAFPAAPLDRTAAAWQASVLLQYRWTLLASGSLLSQSFPWSRSGCPSVMS